MQSRVQKIEKAWRIFQDKIKHNQKKRQEILIREDKDYTEKKLKEVRRSLDA